MSPACWVGVLHSLGWAPQEMEAWRTTPRQLLKGVASLGLQPGHLCRMAPQLLPLLLLLLAGPPAARPAPPTCYSRMLTLSREITADFQSLQATEPAVSAPQPACRPEGSTQTPFLKTCLWIRNRMLFFFSVNLLYC